MQEYVTDTHSLLWYLSGNRRLSKKATDIFNNADEGNVQIYIPAIVLVEIVYIMEKAKIPKKSINLVIDLLDSSPSNYLLCQITPRTIHALQSLQRSLVPDMPDRIIAATAFELRLPLITKDKMIIKSKLIKTIWRMSSHCLFTFPH